MLFRIAAAILAVFLLLVPAPMSAAGGSPARAIAVTGSPVHFPQVGPATTSLTARNLTWNSSVASPPPVPGSPGGKGLSAMETQGSITMLFETTQTGATYTRMYDENNNTWWTVGGAVHPPAVANFSMAYDSGFSGGVAILFDGDNVSSGTPYNGTWLFYFSNDTWRGLSFASGPTGRDDAAFAADTSGPFALLVGGYNSTSGSAYDDWWSLNFTQNSWTLLGLAPPIVPGQSRYFGSSLLSYTHGRYILFGGCSLSIPIICTNDTEEISTSNGITWTYAAPNATTGPVSRAFGDWVWDPFNQFAVLYGGEGLGSSIPTILGDTWVYLQGKNIWVKEVSPPKAPPARYFAAATWVNVSTNETMLMLGGALSGGATGGALWRLSPTATVSILVTNTSGSPLKGARGIVFADGFNWSSTTGGSGTVVLQQVASGPSLIVANASGYYQGSTRAVTQPGGSVSVHIVLGPLPQLWVRTWLSSPSGKTYLGGVSILWNASTVPVNTTNARGYWNDTPWHGGPVTLTGEETGYSTATNSTTIPTTGRAYLNLTLTQITPTNLTVHVVDPLGTGIGSVPVNVANRTTTLNVSGSTDPAGYANFTGLPGGDNATVSANPVALFYANSTGTYLVPGKNVSVNLTLTPWPILSLHVVWWNAALGAYIGVGGAVAIRNGSTPLGTTGVRGWLNVTTSQGFASLSARATDFYPGYASTTLNHTGMDQVMLILVPWPSLHIHVLGLDPLGVRVPLSGADTYRNNSLTPLGLTNASGWFNVTTSPGPANVSAKYPNYLPDWRNVVLNYTGPMNVTLILKSQVGLLSVRVFTTLGPQGNTSNLYPLPFAQVNATSSLPVFTNQSGYANETLLQGNYTVGVWKFGFKPVADQGPFYLRAASVLNLTFTLYPLQGANVSVLVHDKNTSKAIFDATVELGMAYLEHTDHGGWAYFLDVLPPARYQLYVSASGYYPNGTNVTLTFKEVVPMIEVNLTPLPPSHSNIPGNASFSLVPPQEKYLWWPFIILPIAFAAGSILVILAQRSSGRREGQA